MLDAALKYLRAGLCVLPAYRGKKHPALASWKEFQEHLPDEDQILQWCRGTEALCLICGAVSGNLEMIDFDLQGKYFKAWSKKVQEADPALFSRLVIERSPSGGYHVAYRYEGRVCGNVKLAQEVLYVDDSQDVMIAGKPYKPRQDSQGRWHVLLTAIETRGEGGLFLCAPTPGYELIQGDFAQLPVLTANEREILLEAAWSFNTFWGETINGPKYSTDSRPGDEFNQRGDICTLLQQHGWTLVTTAGSRGNEYWRRPGKTTGVSATRKDGVFYVFSTNAAPFEAGRGYSPFAVYALLEHNGDFSAAAKVLQQQGYGTNGGLSVRLLEDEETAPPKTQEEGTPLELLDVPGFIRQVVDYTLSVSLYPHPVVAFGAALALQAFLAGRKICDELDTRTNLYVLVLANSGVGKNKPRHVNQRILCEVGLQDHFRDGIASGEAIEDHLFTTPSLLFHTDEFDSLINAISKGRDAYHENIMSILLKLYTSSNTLYPKRIKAGERSAGLIDQPSLCLFGTAVPKSYYEALNVRMLNNGFFARLIILEAPIRQEGQDPTMRPIPEQILAIAKWWADFQPGEGNLREWHPAPVCIETTPGAKESLKNIRKLADAHYSEAEDKDDLAGMAIWARAYEKTRKLALIYAASKNHLQMQIDEAAVDWAWRFVEYQTRQMLLRASEHVAEGEFDAKCKRMLEVLSNWSRRQGDRPMPYWELARRLKWSDREIEEVRNALITQKRIAFEVGSTPRGGPVTEKYKLLK